MKTIQAPKSVLTGLIGQPAKSGYYKPSIFNFYLGKDSTIMLHTLRRHLVELNDDELQILRESRIFYNESSDDATVKELINSGFLINENIDENQQYLDVIATLRLMKNEPADKYFYKIFSTLECNARCFYCFEPDHSYQPMLPETVDAVFEYIMRTKGKGRVTLYWFGGEPLCNPDAISGLSQKLADAGVDYVSTMVTNGSLLDAAMIEHACSLWNLKKVQITLDGMEKEHNKRKRYKEGIANPFQTTIENIELALASGIAVSLRLNFDSKNVNDIWNLIEFLIEKFKGNPKLSIYPALLFEDFFSWKDKRPGEARKMIRAEWVKMRQRLQETGFLKLQVLEDIPRLKHCMANNERCAIINADGRLFACENCMDSMVYGNVKDGITDAGLYNRWVHEVHLQDKCKGCVLLPECTAFDMCPSKSTDCYEEHYDALFRKIVYTLQELNYKG